MRIVLRLIALSTASMFALTAWQVSSMLVQPGLVRALLGSGVFGWLTTLGWLVTLASAPLATVQLWRFRASGRKAGLVLFATGLAYYALGAALFRTADAPWTPIIGALAYFTAGLALLASPGARAAVAPRR